MRAPSPLGQILKIFFLSALLVFLLLSRDRCGAGIANLFKVVEGPATDGGARDALPPRGD